MHTKNFIFQCLILLPLSTFGQSWFRTGQQADLMVSGVDFNQTGGALQFNHPNGLATDGKNLLLCDRFNNRVLIWNEAPGSWNIKPDLVIGQADFNSNNPGTLKNEMNWPGNVSVGNNGKLAVADTDNDRILLWNSFPRRNGQEADISIHLPSISPPGLSLKWAWPWGVWTDGHRLAVVATTGASILFWNSFPTQDHQPPDYTISNPKFGTPRNISTDGKDFFFVGDHNARVNGVPGTFFWNGYPSISNQPYDFYRDEWIKGTKLSNGQLIASGINHIYTWHTIPNRASYEPDFKASPACYDNGDGVDVVEANSLIYVCNYNGNSILVYQTPPDLNNPDPAFALGVYNFNHNTLDSIGYIQNPSFATDGTRLIVSSDFDKRFYIYDNFPSASGQKADQIISTSGYNLAAWDIALHKNIFVAGGLNKICIWNNADNLIRNPSQIFNGNIGSAIFSDIKGIALDSSFLYVADRNGKIYLWNGIPNNNSENPIYTINFGNVQLNRLASDGQYLCVTQQSPAAIFIYKVSDLNSGLLNPWKTISGIGFLNLPSEAITFNGSLAIANQSFHDVLLWKDIQDAPNSNQMVVLGNSSNAPSNPPAIGSKNLFMPGSILYNNKHLWVGEHKFSSRILRFSYSTSGATQNFISEDIKLFPNPCYDQVVISFGNEEDHYMKTYEVWDNAGNLINSGSGWEQNITISTDHLSEGIYFLKVKGKTCQIKKMVKF